ncbi:hypothetical protein HPP92_009670 [Vanilla planifolia]|uniref:Uncharacterized protein n=1 Tax=Vanilla planifolia TaxID=51239 RepID=A0A835V767_VANPL|nr:hypothetical protein HPP92_009670 [Vanilla planifolia]
MVHQILEDGQRTRLKRSTESDPFIANRRRPSAKSTKRSGVNLRSSECVRSSGSKKRKSGDGDETKYRRNLAAEPWNLEIIELLFKRLIF